jgi:hypothetical protein
MLTFKAVCRCSDAGGLGDLALIVLDYDISVTLEEVRMYNRCLGFNL